MSISLVHEHQSVHEHQPFHEYSTQTHYFHVHYHYYQQYIGPSKSLQDIKELHQDEVEIEEGIRKQNYIIR